MFYFILSSTKCFRAPAVILSAGTLSLLLVLASTHRVDPGFEAVFDCSAGIAMSIAWLVANLLMAVASDDWRASISNELRPLIAPMKATALIQWHLGALAVVVAISVAYMPIGMVAAHPPSSWALPLFEMLHAIVAAAASALVVAILSALLPRAAAIAASGGWLLLCSGAGSPTQSAFERFVAAPLFPLSPALVRADETAHFSGSLQAVGSVALFDLGLLLLLVAIELRRRR